MTPDHSPQSGRPRMDRSKSLSLLASVCSAALIGAPLAAEETQAQPVPELPESDIELGIAAGASDNEILVQGDRLRGQLLVEQAPLLELNESDIAAEGVTSVADLVTQVTNQTGSARGRGGGGRPVILVNGIRIGSFRELASYPPEALAKVEVFPEEVAQRFGFSPDRRVINLILKENYSSREIELEFEGPSRGGYMALEQEFGFLQIANGGRINANLEARDTSLLTEAERNVIQTEGSVPEVAGDPNQADFRSLVPDGLSLEANLSWAKALIESGTAISANLNYEREESRSLSGLNAVELTDAGGASLFRTFGENDPLERRSSTDTYSLAGSLTRPLGALRLTATFDASLEEEETEIDRRFDTSAFEADALAGSLALDGALPTSADAGFDVAFTRNWSATSKATVRGPLANLPGGEVVTTLDLGYSWNRIESEDTRTAQSTALTRGDLEAGLNVVAPLTSRLNGFADALGSFTFNAQAGIDELSDFGTLTDWSAGLTWAPFDNLDLSATYIRREVAPSLSNLGNSQVTSFNVPVFDFVNGDTVLATVITGGNPNLLAETQADWKFGANWQLPFWDNTRFNVEYIRNRSDNVTSSFPVLTDEIEAAFPDRVTRDATGTLVALDRRPVTFTETRSNRLQFTLSTRGSWGQGGAGQGRRGGPPPVAGGPPRGEPAGGAPGARPSADRAGLPTEEQRTQMVQFRERICADDGLQVLTQLVQAIESGQDLSAMIPNFDRERFERILSRMRDDNGQIPPENIERFRDRFCSKDPSSFRGGPRQAAQDQPGAGGPPAGARGGPPGNPLTRGFGREGRGRYFLNLTHSVELDNEILVAPGGPVLDLLDGDATGQFGQARHSTRLEGGIFRNGMGMRVSGRYSGPSRIDGTGLPGSTDLFFGDLVTFDLRFFGDLGQILGQQEGFLNGLRIALRADNILDTRREVTDANGDTPINYQPFVIDPTGRFLGIDIRKIF